MSENFRSFEFWEIPTNATARESPPTTISAKHEADFNTMLRAAGQVCPSGDADLFVYLGVDMGTSSTKVVARLPFEPGQPCLPVPAPQHCRSDDHPALWQTVLWMRNSSFSACPSSDARPLHNLKQAAVRASFSSQTPLHSVRLIQATAAYLGYVIRHAKGWLLSDRASLFRRRSPKWIVQVGLPAKSCDETYLASAYRRMALAGMRLSQSSDEIAFSDAATMLGRDDVVRASTSNDKSLEQGVAVFPEIAAATTSFSKSNERANGLYLIVDVGAMTMDVCAFYLGRKRGGDTYSVFAADVRPLGVEALHWFLQSGKSRDGFRTQISRCLEEVVTKTKREYWKAPEFRPGNDLPFFFVGGGSNSHVHEEQLNKIGRWMNKYYAHDGLRRLEISVPTAIDMSSIETGRNPSGKRQDLYDLSRLFVALGLSYPDSEIGKVFLPSEIQPTFPDTGDNYRQKFISKDDV